MSKDFELIIGNKNYSAWSLCAWLCLKTAKINFKEKKITLGIKGSRKIIKQHSPSGFVPSLKHGNLIISDSLAIAEYINEFLKGGLLPSDSIERAKCRSVIAELHSGFRDLRREAPMNIKLKFSNIELSYDAQKQYERIQEILEELLNNRNSYLFGSWGMADIFYSHIAIRILNYNLPCSNRVSNYCKKLLNNKYIREWINDAKLEKETIAAIDSLQKK